MIIELELRSLLIVVGWSLLTNDDVDHIYSQINQFEPFGLSQKGGGKGGFHNHVNIAIAIIDVVVITIMTE